MKYAHHMESTSKTNQHLSQISPTTSITTKTNVNHRSFHEQQLPTNCKHMNISLDYPLCSSLLNEHLFHADFYSGLGPYTINTEWLV